MGFIQKISNTLPTAQKGMLCALLGYTGFSCSDVAIKTLGQTYSIFQVLTINLLVASALLIVYDALKNPSKLSLKTRLSSKVMKLHVLRGILNFVLAGLFVTALMALPMATVYTLIFTKPFYAVIITAIIYKEKMLAHRWISIVLGFIGILIVVRPATGNFDPIMIAPLAGAVLAALLFVVAKSMHGESNFKMGFYPSFIAGLLCMPIAFAQGFVTSELTDLPLILISGIGINIGIIFVSKAYTIAPSATVAPFHYSQILWGLLFGYFVFSETPDILTFVGAAFVIGSGLYLLHKERRIRPDQT